MSYPACVIAPLLLVVLGLASNDTAPARSVSQGPGFAIETHSHRPSTEPVLVVDARGSSVDHVWEVTAQQPFRELVASWNLAVPDGCGAVVELQVATGSAESAWLHLGEWGVEPQQRAPLLSPLGQIHTDWFQAKEPITQARLRVRAHGSPAAKVRIARLDMVLSDRTNLSGKAALDARPPVERSRWARRLPVPFRTQRSAGETIASRVCSPTSTSMVMAYRGIDVPLETMCARAFDLPNNIYGNWPRNVQAAYTFGVPGRLARFSHWRDVEQHIADGSPLVISIRVRQGELRGAPYEKTDGHLVVITGVTAAGEVLVNDPATSDVAKGMCTWSREDLEVVWMGRGGLAYLL